MSEPCVSLLSALEPRSPAGESGPWERAFETHYVELCDYLRCRVRSAEVGQDLVQDLFLRLWDRRGPQDAARLTPAYLYVAARNRALKYVRHRHVAQAWIDRFARVAAAVDTPEDLCLHREPEDTLRRAIADLPDRCREIFLLRRRDELSYQDIAARLGLSLGTVRCQLWQATVRLKETLARYLELALPASPPRRAKHHLL